MQADWLFSHIATSGEGDDVRGAELANLWVAEEGGTFTAHPVIRGSRLTDFVHTLGRLGALVRLPALGAEGHGRRYRGQLLTLC